MSTPAPREGLPPCYTRVAVFEGRQATWHSEVPCENPRHSGHFVLAGTGCGTDASETPLLQQVEFSVLHVVTDDPAEAEAAFERGERWVRTKVLDD